MDQILFVFDDLERTTCNMKDLLGFFNNFVEEYNAKVLIIGNVEKIGVDREDQATETLNNKSYTLDEKDKTNPKSDQLSLYKEKFIRYEINFTPKFNEVVKALSDSLEHSNHFNADICPIDDINNMIINAFNKAQNYNLRTLQTIIFNIGCLLRVFSDKRIENRKITLEDKKSFFLNAVHQSIYCKLKIGWPLVGPSEHRKLKLNYRLSFIDVFVSSSLIPWKALLNDIEYYVWNENWERKNQKDPITILLKNYSSLENYEKLVDLFNQARIKLAEFKYPPQKWIDFLFLVFLLEAEKLISSEQKNKIINLIRNKLIPEWDWHDPSLKKFSFVDYHEGSFLIQEGTFKKMDIIRSELDAQRLKIIDERTIESLESSLANKEWEALKQTLNTHIKTIRRQQSFLSFVNEERLKEVLIGMKPKDFVAFGGIISLVYKSDFQINQTEKNYIKQITLWLEDLEQASDKLIQHHRDSLLEYFKKLQNENT